MQKMIRSPMVWLGLLAVVVLLLASCSGPPATQSPAPTEAPKAAEPTVPPTSTTAPTKPPAPTPVPPTATTPPDLLATIKARGYILVSTDPNYAPQSVLKKDGKRTAGTKCPGDVLTAGELEGFDIDVAVELGKRLGVETCFATPSWDSITAGNWGGKWDISVGSMTITTPRQKILAFTSAYYYTPAQLAAQKDAGFTKLEDLKGKAICVGTATTYEDWLGGKLEIPEENIFARPPADVTVVPLDTDQECAQAIKAGRKDFLAYLTSATVVDQNIKAGLPVVKVGSPVYVENLAVAVDKAHKLDITSLVKTLDEFIKAMHADGTLTKFSTQWFGADLTQAPK
jgi:polar amino acid transport system substrate-binding protein